MKRNRKRCYLWVIAGVALLVMFVQLGIVNNPSGIFTGIFLAMPSVAAIVANPLANAVRDRVGSYCPAFLGTAVLSVAVFVLYLLIFAISVRDRKNFEEA